MSCRIALIEPETHHEVLRNLFYLLQEGDFEICCYTNSFNHSQFYEKWIGEKVKFVLQDETESTNQFLDRIQLSLKSFQFILVTSISKPYDELLNNYSQSKRYLVIHHGHRFLYMHFKPCKSSIKAMARFLKFVLFEKRKIKALVNAFDGILMPTKELTNYITNNSTQNHEKIVGSCNLGIPVFRPMVFHRSKIVIGIPGSVDVNMRNYTITICAIEKLMKSGNDMNIELKFIGSCVSSSAKHILKECKKRLESIVKIRFFEGYLDQRSFDREMTDCDFLVCPIQEFSCLAGVNERNGYSHISGSITDAQNFGLPSLIPQTYPINSPLITHYANVVDLAEKLEDWIVNKKFNTIKTHHLGQIEHVRKDKRNAFQSLFNS